MKKLKVGYVGSGFIANFQAKSLEHVRQMELAGVLARSEAEKLSAFAQEKGLGQATLYPTIREMAENVDAIAMFCPNYAQIEVMEEIVEAKKAGAHIIGVMCEKPLGRNLKEAQRLVQLAEEANLLTAYFENQIHMKSIQIKKHQLAPQEQAMGPMSLTRCSEEHAGPHMPWFWDPTRQGGGVLADMGCHSIAVGWYTLTPNGKKLTFLEPQSVTCDIGLLKWGQPKWREALLKQHGVDYTKTPAEDFATGVITFKNPDTGQLVKTQFTDSWMYENQGLRILIDGMGPGYAFEINTLKSTMSLFIGDEAADAIKDGENALEKSKASRGLMTVHPNEADLYGYIDENKDAAEKFLAGQHGLLPLSYGVEITRLVMASYMSAERKQTVDLTDFETRRELETFIPAVQQGKGADLLY